MAYATPITRAQFTAEARHLTVTVASPDGTVLLTQRIDPKEFSTNSLGWNLNAKFDVEVAGQSCKCQVGMNVTLVGSKELPKS